MTPRRMDRAMVERKLAQLDQLLRDLAQLGPVTSEDLRRSPLVRHALVRILTQLTQLAVDVNAHVVGAMGQPGGDDYRSTFAAAAAAGVISQELSQRLQPSVGMRNVLIHEYLAIDLDLVAQAAERASQDYREYVEAVARFLTRP